MVPPHDSGLSSTSPSERTSMPNIALPPPESPLLCYFSLYSFWKLTLSVIIYLLLFTFSVCLHQKYSWLSLVAQLVKNPPAMWETWVRSLGWEDPLEKGKAPHSRSGEFHGLCSPGGCKESDMTERLSLSTSSSLNQKFTPVHYCNSG